MHLLVRVRAGDAPHQVELGADRPRRAGLGRVEHLDDVLGRADVVRGLHDLVLALGVDQDVDAWDGGTDVGHVALGEAPVHRAVPAPQDHAGVAQLGVGQAAVGLAGVEHDAVRGGHAELEECSVASEVLVGHEQDLARAVDPTHLIERPSQRDLRVRGRADGPAVPTREGLDRGGRVHVGDGERDVGDPGVLEDLPRVLDLVDRGHVGHRAARREVRQDDLLGVRGEDVRALGHEVHAAEEDELGLGAGRGLACELERVARDVREVDDLVALVVVAQDEGSRAERGAGRAGTFDEVGVARRRQLAGALDPPLGGQVPALPEQQEGGRGRFRKGVVQQGAHGNIVAQRGRDEGVRPAPPGRPTAPRTSREQVRLARWSPRESDPV
ncbi:hypothetical protein D3C74_313710 [compost metagenome]